MPGPLIGGGYVPGMLNGMDGMPIGTGTVAPGGGGASVPTCGRARAGPGAVKATTSAPMK